MIADSMINQPCTITTRTPTDAKDARGNPVHTTSTADTVCYCEQATAAENTTAQDTQTDRWRLAFLTGTIVTASSIIDVGGRRLEIEGEPWDAWDPFAQRVDHIEVDAVRAKAAVGATGS